VLLGRPAPPLWHGTLPGVDGQLVPGCLLADARPHGQIHEGGRAPVDGGTLVLTRLPGGGVHSPTPPLAPSPVGDLGLRVPGVTTHRVPAVGGRCRPAYLIERCCKYGTPKSPVRCPLFHRNVRIKILTKFTHRYRYSFNIITNFTRLYRSIIAIADFRRNIYYLYVFISQMYLLFIFVYCP